MATEELKARDGEDVPDVTFRVRRDGDWTTTSTEEIFAGKNVVVFSLPGAYTPTCSSTHLPRYNELAPAFRQLGIDSIVCVSVNDPFVMEEWGKDQEATNVLLLPDGNGAFTEAMGMLVDKSDLNFGKRSWRYSMLVRNRRIEKMFLEPNKEGDPFEVSDADTMLRHLDASAKPPEQVAILTRHGCSFCAAAKRLLDDAGIAYAEVPLPHTVRSRVLGAICHAQTVPQVFVDGRHIGGSEQLEAWLGERRAAA